MSYTRRRTLVVAIDLGTDYSVYGFSFLDEYEKYPTKITFPTWYHGTSLTLKQPTCVLCNLAGEFHSFGYEAEDKYKHLSDNKEHYNWYFFRKFKNMLSEKQVNTGFELTDENGLKMPARKVFAMAIRYLKNNVLKTIDRWSHNDIHWVLPVPATWTVSAKDVFREAAKEAGIDGANLIIALEPDAAAVYCEALPSDRLLCGGRFNDDKYMVIDLGDSTAVFSVHEKQPNGTIIDVHKVSSRPWGSTKVNEEFTKMIINIFGDRTFTTFRDHNPKDLVDMLREVEAKNSTIRTDDNYTIFISRPIALEKTYQKITGKTVQDAIEQSPYKGKIQWMAIRVGLDAELFRSFFKNYISSITNHIEKFSQEPGVKGTSAFLMIGKFSECRLVQDAVKKAFPKAKVVVPNKPEVAVMVGAVVLGHKFGLTSGYNLRLQPMNKDRSTVATTTAKRDENDVYSDANANGSTCSSSYEQDIRNDQIKNLKYKSLSEEGEEALSSDCLEMTVQTQDNSTQDLEAQLKNRMTLEADNTRAPSDDELFALSTQLPKFDKEWWLLAKLLGLSDTQVYDIEHGEEGTHIVRKYYQMLIAWKGHNAGQEKGSVRYLLRKCDEAGIDQKVTDTVFGN